MVYFEEKYSIFFNIRPYYLAKKFSVTTMVDCRWLITFYREIQTDIQAFVPAAVVLFVYRVWYYEE